MIDIADWAWGQEWDGEAIILVYIDATKAKGWPGAGWPEEVL